MNLQETRDLGAIVDFVPAVLRLADSLFVFLSGLSLTLLLVSYRLGVELPATYVVVAAVGALVVVLVTGSQGGYQRSRLETGQGEGYRATAAWAVTAALLIAVGFGLKVSDHYSRFWAMSWFATCCCYFFASRCHLAWLIESWTRQGHARQRVAVVGTQEQADRLFGTLSREGDGKIDFLGVFSDHDDPETQGSAAVDRGRPHLSGTVENLIARSRSERIDVVIVALPWTEERRIMRLLERLRNDRFEVQLAPDLVGYELVNRPLRHLAGVPLLRVWSRPLGNWSTLAKRIEDLLLASLFLLLAGPAFAVIAFAIKLDSRGPVFFRQRRYGFNAKAIEVWTFRTVYLERSGQVRARATARDAPRVTRIGRLLRRSNLDALPQLFNVLHGEMSLVGPRPHPPRAQAGERLCEEVIDEFCSRHRVRPGITGWAQVNGMPGNADAERKLVDRFQYDLFYVENWSLLFDLRILMKTVAKVIDAENASPSVPTT